MINELYKLSAAMDEAGIRTQSWHRKYKPIPNIRATAPCVRLVLAEGVITDFSEVSADLGAGLRKYGSNQGSYPCMNLAPLYRVTEEPIKKQLASLRPEKLTAEKLQELKSWCSVDNWNRKFLGKYKISMVNTSAELRAAAAEYEPLRILIEQSNLLADPAAFRQALETAVWKKLGRGEDTELALRILFYQGKANQAAEDDYGSLSVALEAEKLIDAGKPTVNRVFVRNSIRRSCTSMRRNRPPMRQPCWMHSAHSSILWKSRCRASSLRAALTLRSEPCSKSSAARPGTGR